MSDGVIRPTDPMTETVARVCVAGSVVTCRFPETNRDFREIVHALGYSWAHPYWRREIGERAGEPLDRAAELGAHLLAGGFCVEFDNDDARQRCVDRSYEPECRRWIRMATGDNYAGWFYVWWGKGEKDCYNIAIRISGAKYAPPCVVVPREHFDEVCDFAEMNGFQFEPDALELVERARAERDAALVVDFSTDDLPQAATNWTRPDLEPQEFDVDPSLLDDDETV